MNLDRRIYYSIYYSIFVLAVYFFNGGLFTSLADANEKSPHHTAGVLLLSDIRLSPFQGFKDGLATLGMAEGDDKNIHFIIRNASGEKSKLPELARELVALKPDIVIAGGGVEADALKAATMETTIPLVFLSVSSSVDRGLVLSLRSSGNHLTGIDTADTELTGRRLWFITKMFPKVKRVYILHVPSITPSRKSLEKAREMAEKLGLELMVETGETREELIEKAESFTAAKGDVILLLPVAPVSSIVKQHLFPKAMKAKIPIFGYGRVEIDTGAAASLAGSRYQNGFQAAGLAKKILDGASPSSLPIEQPQKTKFVINKWVIDQLGIHLPERILQLADEIVNKKIE